MSIAIQKRRERRLKDMFGVMVKRDRHVLNTRKHKFNAKTTLKFPTVNRTKAGAGGFVAFKVCNLVEIGTYFNKFWVARICCGCATMFEGQ